MESGYMEIINLYILISLVIFYMKVYLYDYRICLNYYLCVNNER